MKNSFWSLTVNFKKKILLFNKFFRIFLSEFSSNYVHKGIGAWIEFESVEI